MDLPENLTFFLSQTKAKVLSRKVTFWFPHTTKRDRKRGREGWDCEDASRFRHCAQLAGYKVDLEGIFEEGTRISVIIDEKSLSAS